MKYRRLLNKEVLDLYINILWVEENVLLEKWWFCDNTVGDTHSVRAMIALSCTQQYNITSDMNAIKGKSWGKSIRYYYLIPMCQWFRYFRERQKVLYLAWLQ